MTPNINCTTNQINQADPRMRDDNESSMTPESTTLMTPDNTSDMFKVHVDTVEKECSSLFAEYMKVYNQDPNSEITRSALEQFNSRYDHLKKLQNMLNHDQQEQNTMPQIKQEPSPEIKEERKEEYFGIPKSELVFLRLKDEVTGYEKSPGQKIYDTARDFCNAFEAMLIKHRLTFSENWEKTLPLCLNKEDKRWFKEKLAGKKYLWKDARQALINQKQTSLSRLSMMMEMCNLRQDRMESIKSYAFKFQKLCKEAHIKDGTMLGVQFLVSLDEEAQQSVKAALERTESIPRSLNDMVEFVIKIEEKERPSGSKRSYERAYESKSSDKPKKRSKFAPCDWCSKPFVPGHKCQAFYDHKSKLYEYNQASKMR